MDNKNSSKVIGSPAERYQLKLKSIIREILTDDFVAKTWIRKNGMQSNFIEACVVSGFIKPVNNIGRRVIYQSNYKPEEITVEHGASIHQALRQLNEELQKRKKEHPKPEKIEVRRTEIVHVPTPIPDYSEMNEDQQEKILKNIPVEHMIIELRKRGYEGTVSRMEEYKIR